MRALIVILVLLLIVLAMVAAFAAGYVADGVVHPDRVTLSPVGQAQAKQAGDLQTRVIQELLANYYKKIDVAKLEKAGVDGALKSLHDPWTVYMPPKETQDFQDSTNGTYVGIGAALQKKGTRLLVTEVFDGSPAKDAAIRIGDQIVTVDGQATAPLSVEANIARIRGPAGTQVKLEVRHTGSSALIPLTLTRRSIALPETKTRLIHSGGKTIGYIDLFEFARGVGRTVHTEIGQLQSQGAQAIILDLRYNGGGLVNEAVNVTSDFLSSGVVVSTEGLHSPKEVYQARPGLATSLPLVVLVNQWTASSSEITAGALQDHQRGEIIGTRTFGKGLVQTIVDMPGGASLKITIAVYLTPNGRDINHLGIEPDIVVKDLPKTKADEALNRAIRYIVAGQ